MDIREQFLADVEGFLDRNGMTPTRFGVLSLNDKAFVFRLREDRSSPTLATVQKVRDFMATWKPTVKQHPKRAACQVAA